MEEKLSWLSVSVPLSGGWVGTDGAGGSDWLSVSVPLSGGWVGTDGAGGSD